MQTNLVLTVIGDDKPGLVESLSRVIADHGDEPTAISVMPSFLHAVVFFLEPHFLQALG